MIRLLRILVIGLRARKPMYLSVLSAGMRVLVSLEKEFIPTVNISFFIFIFFMAQHD